MRDQIKKTGVAIVNIGGKIESITKIHRPVFGLPCVWTINGTIELSTLNSIKLATKEEVIEYFFGGENVD